MTNISELTSPIRIYWDIGPCQAEDASYYRRVCEELVENKVLSLNLLESEHALTRSCFSILEQLKHGRLAVSLTVLRSALNVPAIELLQQLKVKALFIRATSSEELQPIADLWNKAHSILPLGVSFEVNRKNYNDLPDLLSFCIRTGISFLVLPIQRLAKEEECFSLSREERRDLDAKINVIDRPQSMKLTIHDPFLWRVFYPVSPFPDGGCQAANTMLHISPEADVYPCPSLPIKIGSLLTSSLKNIIRSPAKQEVRKKIVSVPKACLECHEGEMCKGGCRGRAWFIKKSLDEPDPGCA